MRQVRDRGVCLGEAPPRKEKGLTQEELFNAPILICDQVRGMVSRTERSWQDIAKDGTHLNIVMYAGDHRMLKRAVRDGLGVGFTYRGFSTKGLRRGIYKISR